MPFRKWYLFFAVQAIKYLRDSDILKHAIISYFANHVMKNVDC